MIQQIGPLRAGMSGLSHFDEHGQSRMVDVGDKPITARAARASGRVLMSADTWALVRDRRLAKGDVLEVARLAGIMAAKRTSEWIPLCHTLPLDAVEVEFDFSDDGRVEIQATARATSSMVVFEYPSCPRVWPTSVRIIGLSAAIELVMTMEPPVP